MEKYSYELEKKIVEEYLSGKTSHPVLENKYQIDESQIRRWVKNYNHFGDEGLMRSRYKRSYSEEFKLEAITRYETSKCSYQQLALELPWRTHPWLPTGWDSTERRALRGCEHRSEGDLWRRKMNVIKHRSLQRMTSPLMHPHGRHWKTASKNWKQKIGNLPFKRCSGNSKAFGEERTLLLR